MAFERTWQAFINRSMDFTSLDYNRRSIAWSIKALLKGEYSLVSQGGSSIPTGSIQGKWTHYKSCDASSVSSVSDLWTSSYNPLKVWPLAVTGFSFSWIVLQSPSSMGPVWLTISMEGPTIDSVNFALSYAAPFGGSTSSRPSSFFETTWTGSSGQGKLAPVGTYIDRTHGGLTSAGDFYFVTSDAGFLPWVCVFQKLSETKASDLYPVVGLMNSAASAGLEPLSRSQISVADPAFCKARHVTNRGIVNPSAVSWWTSGGSVGLELSNAPTIPSGLDPVDGLPSSMPVYFWNGHYGKYSIKGRLSDIQWCNQLLASGDVLSAIGMNSMVVADMLLPSFGIPNFT